MDAMNRNKLENDLQGGFANRQASGKLPAVLPNPLLLNLGCGNDIRDGFLNFDLFSNDPRVIYMDIRKIALDSNVADVILASDILEHFSHREIDSLLKEWNRILKINGELIIRCPSLKLQMEAYLKGHWNADIASYMIFGGQTNPGDYHCVAFDEISIKQHLKKAGFDVYHYEEHNFPQDRGFINLNMTVRAKKVESLIIQNEIPEIKFPKEQTIPKNQEELKKVLNSSDPFEKLDFKDDDSIDSLELQNDNSTLLEEFSEFNNQLHVNNEIDNNEKMPFLNIVWEGSQFVYHSFALINREQCLNLIKSEVANLTVIPYEPDQFDWRVDDRYRKIHENDIRYKPDAPSNIASLPYIWIRHQWPPKAEAPQGAKWIINQPWEFSRLTKKFVQIFQNADEIWVPSNFTRNAYIASGLDFNKVQIVPNGVNPEVFKPIGKVYKLGTKKKFKFLYVGGTIFRKGIDVLLKAYTKAFTSEDDVCLVIKDMGGDSFYKGQTAFRMIEEIRKQPNSPEIEYIDTYIEESEQASLYRACNVFVSSYRGEGFSLPTLEAMASGLPVVVTEGGSTDDFTDSAFTYYIPATQRSVGTILDGMEFTDEAYVLEPDMNELSNILLNIYTNPSNTVSMGILASLTARKFWTWNRATLKALSRIDTLYNMQMTIEAEKFLIDNDDILIHLGIAENAYLDSNYELAKEQFQLTLNDFNLNDKYRCHILHRLALICISENQLSDAESYLNKVKNINGEHPDTKYLKVILNVKRDNLNTAQELISQLLDEWHESRYESTFGLNLDDLLVLTGDLLLNSEDIESAHKVYSSALHLNSDNPYACFGVGKCFIEFGAYQEATTMLEWAVRLNPDFEEAATLFENLKAQMREESIMSN